MNILTELKDQLIKDIRNLPLDTDTTGLRVKHASGKVLSAFVTKDKAFEIYHVHVDYEWSDLYSVKTGSLANGWMSILNHLEAKQ